MSMLDWNARADLSRRIGRPPVRRVATAMNAGAALIYGTHVTNAYEQIASA